MQKDRNTEKGSNIQTSVTHLKMSREEDQNIFGQNQHQPVYTILTMRCEFFLKHMWVPNANTWDIDRFFLTHLPTVNIWDNAGLFLFIFLPHKCGFKLQIYGILTDWGQDDQSVKVFLT